MTQKTLVSLLAALSLATPISAQVPPIPGSPDAATDIVLPGKAELPGQDTYSVRVRDLETKELKLPNFDDDNPNDLAYVTLEPGKKYAFELDDPTEYFNLNKATGTKFFTEGGSKIKKGKNEKYLVVLPGTTTKYLPFQFVAPFTMRARFVNKYERGDRDELVISDREEPVEVAGSVAGVPTLPDALTDASTDQRIAAVAPDAATDGATDLVVSADGETDLVEPAPTLWSAYASLGFLGLSEEQTYSALPLITQLRERNLTKPNYVAGFEAGVSVKDWPVNAFTFYFTRATANADIKTRLGTLYGVHNVNGNNTYGAAANVNLENLLHSDNEFIQLDATTDGSTDGNTDVVRVVEYQPVEQQRNRWKDAFLRLNVAYATHTKDVTHIAPTLLDANGNPVKDAQGNPVALPAIIQNSEVFVPSFGFDLHAPNLGRVSLLDQDIDLGLAAGWNHERLKTREIRDGEATPFSYGGNDEAHILALLHYEDVINGSLGLDFQRESNHHYPGAKLGESAPASWGHGIRGNVQWKTGFPDAYPVTAGLDFGVNSPLPVLNDITYNHVGITLDTEHAELGFHRYGRELARTPGKVTLMDDVTSYFFTVNAKGLFGDDVPYVPKKSGAQMFRKFANHKP